MKPVARRFTVGAAYGAAGVAAVVGAFTHTTEFPRSATYWVAFGAFLAIVVLFSARSAEVDDRMWSSSSAMVIMTAAGFLSSAVSDAGGAPAAFTVTLLAVSDFYTVGDLTERKVFRPVANFGQLAAAGFCAGSVYDLVIGAISLDLFDAVGVLAGGVISATGQYVIVGGIAGVAAGTTYAVVNVVAVRLGMRVLYGPKMLLSWATSVTVIRAEAVQASLGAVLGILLAQSPSVALVALILTVFVIGQRVFTSYASLRATHEATLRGFVKILETRDLYTRGHTERVVEFSLAIGKQLGFSGTQLARMRLAALIHDVGKLAVPTEIMRKQSDLTPEEYHEMRVATHKVDDLLSQVEFLDPMVELYSGCHPKWEGEDFGQARHVHSRRPTVEQCVLAVADAFDAMTSTRSYRMAMPQAVALDRLSQSDDPLISGGVVAALRKALAEMGNTYGPPLSSWTPDAAERTLNG